MPIHEIDLSGGQNSQPKKKQSAEIQVSCEEFPGIDRLPDVLFNTNGLSIGINEIAYYIENDSNIIENKSNGSYISHFITSVVCNKSFYNNIQNEGSVFLNLHAYNNLSKKTKKKVVSKVNTDNFHFIMPLELTTLQDKNSTKKYLNEITNALQDEFIQKAKSIRYVIHLPGHWVVLNIIPGQPPKFQMFDGIGMTSYYNELLKSLETKFNSKPELISGYQNDGRNCGPYACEIITSENPILKVDEINNNSIKFANDARAAHKNMFNYNNQIFSTITNANQFSDKVFKKQDDAYKYIRIVIDLAGEEKYLKERANIEDLAKNILKFYNPNLNISVFNNRLFIQNPQNEFDKKEVISFLNENLTEFANLFKEPAKDNNEKENNVKVFERILNEKFNKKDLTEEVGLNANKENKQEEILQDASFEPNNLESELKVVNKTLENNHSVDEKIIPDVDETKTLNLENEKSNNNKNTKIYYSTAKLIPNEKPKGIKSDLKLNNAINKIDKQKNKLEKEIDNLEKLSENKFVNKLFGKVIEKKSKLKKAKVTGLNSVKQEIMNQSDDVGIKKIIKDKLKQGGDLTKGRTSRTKKMLKKIKKDYSISNKGFNR